MQSIVTGGMTVLDSMSFLAVGLGETTLHVGKDNEHLRFVLDFISAEKEDHSVTSEVIDDKSLRIKITNFNSSLGTTLTSPVPVGTFAGRKLFVLFRVAKVSDQTEVREVLFTTYLGEEVKDGTL